MQSAFCVNRKWPLLKRFYFEVIRSNELLLWSDLEVMSLDEKKSRREYVSLSYLLRVVCSSVKVQHHLSGWLMKLPRHNNCTGPPLNLVKRNFPQSNVTWLNKSNIVTVIVFGNLYRKENTTAVCGEASDLPPILPTLRHVSAWKTASVTGKKF